MGETAEMNAPRRDAIVGVVLAGGQSHRMGQDKALLCYQGRTLIDHMLAKLAATGIKECVVSGKREGWQHIADAIPGLGPIGALHTLAQAYAGRRLLIVPVDMPALPVAWLHALLRSVPDARCAHFIEHRLPLRIDCDGATRSQLASMVANVNAPGSIGRFVSAVFGVEIPWPEGASAQNQPDDALTNLNTPTQWQEFNA